MFSTFAVFSMVSLAIFDLFLYMLTEIQAKKGRQKKQNLKYWKKTQM